MQSNFVNNADDSHESYRNCRQVSPIKKLILLSYSEQVQQKLQMHHGRNRNFIVIFRMKNLDNSQPNKSKVNLKKSLTLKNKCSLKRNMAFKTASEIRL